MMTFLWRHRELVAIAVLLAAVWFLFNWGRSERIGREEAENGLKASLEIANEKDQTIETYENKLKDQVIVINTIQLDKKNLEKVAAIEKLNLQKSFNVQIKKIQSITSFNLKSKLDSAIRNNNFLTPTSDSFDSLFSLETESKNLRLFEYKDEFNDLRFYVDDSSRFSQTDSIKGIDVRSRPKRWAWKFLTFRKWRETSTYQITNRNKMIGVNRVIKMEIARKR